MVSGGWRWKENFKSDGKPQTADSYVKYGADVLVLGLLGGFSWDVPLSTKFSNKSFELTEPFMYFKVSTRNSL